MRASDRTFSKRHHQRRTRHRIVNNHAAHAVDPRDQLWRHNLLRRALRHNLAVAQRNQMCRVAARPFKSCNTAAGVPLRTVQLAQQLQQVNLMADIQPSSARPAA